MKLSIITLTFNKLEYTKKYIESLYKYTSDFELIIVDNGSTDGTVEYLKTLKNVNVKLILNAENKGFSAGNNQALEIAKGDYIAFFNNDILLSPNWFDACEKVFLSNNAGFVSPVQIDPHYNDTSERLYLSYFNSQTYSSHFEKNFDDCVFSCVVTKKNVLDKIGNFDENFYPAFFEDNDLKCRALNEGFDLFVTYEACFFHYGSITSLNYNFNFEKNRNYFYSKSHIGEYLSISGEKYRLLQLQNMDFQRTPLKQIYSIYLFSRKCFRKLHKLLGD